MTSKNKARIRKIFFNFSFLAAGKTIGDIFTFFMFVLLSRTFGQEGIGQYSFAIAFTGFFAVFADFGLQGLTIKKLSRETEFLGNSYSSFFSLRIILSAIALILLLVLMPFLPFTSETKLIILLIGVFQVIYRSVDGFLAIFIAQEETHIAGILDASIRAINTTIAATIIIGGGSLVAVIATLPIVTLVQVALTYGLVAWKHGRPKFITSARPLISLAREAVPYTLSVMLYQLRTRIDVIFLGLFLGAAAVGIYNVAYRVIFLLSFIPYFAAVALFPQASRLYVNSKEELVKLYRQSLNMAVLAGLPIAAGLWLIAPALINLIFGENFEESVYILRLLAWISFLAFLLRLLMTFLVACDREKQAVKCQWQAVLVNGAGNLLLIPSFGVQGAAIATLMSETVLVILYVMQVKTVLGWPKITSRLAISAVGVVSFCLPFFLLPELSIAVVIPASMLLYLTTLLLFKETRQNDIQAIVGLLRQEP